MQPRIFAVARNATIALHALSFAAVAAERPGTGAYRFSNEITATKRQNGNFRNEQLLPGPRVASGEPERMPKPKRR